ncbi:MAG TPA: protein kinase [Pyrinomonadaceae bacterium]|jgi:serine/threonine protein kinase
MGLNHFLCGAFVNDSERYAAEYLKSRLQNHAALNDWVLLTNYANSSSSQYLSDELDLVVVGPGGISVVEIKHWNTADLKGNKLSIAEAEAEKINEKAKRLRGKLTRNCSFDFGFVEGKLLFTRGENEKYVEGITRRRIRGVEVFGLTEWKDLLDVSARTILTNDQIAHISRVLHPQATALANNEIQNFDNTFFELKPVERINTPFRRIYHARRKPGRDKVLLHIYDLTASTEKNAIDIARREFEILQRLQKSIWLPNLMDSFQEAKNYPGELYFFSYIDTESPTLAERAKDENWSLDERIYTTFRCIEALGEIHSEGMNADDTEVNNPILHRNLTPETIHVRSNNEPLLTQLHLAKLPGANTVAAAAPHNYAGLEQFFAPEVLAQGIGASSKASDVYSLCASLSVIFTDAPEHFKLPQTDEILKVLRSGLETDLFNRARLAEIYNNLIGIFDEQEPDPPKVTIPAVRYWDEDTIFELHSRFYRVITKLGEGGFGKTFKVMEVDPRTTEDISGPYVAKAITNEAAGREAAIAYSRVRAQSGGAHLAGVLEVVSEWRPDSVTALLKWIKGEPLSDYTGVLPIYFDELGIESHEDTILMWIANICDALTQLHEVGLVHGDVSPRNIIVDGSNIILTDFDTATRVGNQSIGFNPIYCPPEIEAHLPVGFSDDLYALAATIFQTLFDRKPFHHAIYPDKRRGLNWHDIDQSEWKRLSKFLNHATHTDRSQRFASAMDAQNFLRSLSESGDNDNIVPFVTEPILIRTDNEVAWLSQLLQSYPGSPKGNAETRGLDSDFAKFTYVETALDEILADDIKNRRVSLVILCGNAGDGKTAFLQNLAKNLGLEVGTSAQRIWDMTLPDGLKFYANLDGSAAFQGRTANELLDECFAPFQNGEFPEDIVHLIAVNDGKLLEWLEERDDSELTEELYAALEDDYSELNPRIRFIDLNKRSLVGGFQQNSTEVSADFVDKLLWKMLGGETDVWQPCHSCTAQSRCHAWASVDALRDQERGVILREKLTQALLAVHQRGEIHITARSLRAALVYIFFGTLECRDLHENPNLFPAMYYDRAFDFYSAFRQGDLLTELSRLDPALESHPEIDRYLLKKAEDKSNHNNQFNEQPSLDSLRRQAYFEWTRQEIERIGGNGHALGLAKSEHLEKFLLVESGNDSQRQEICSQLCEGIARLEDLPEAAFDADRNSIPLKITPRTPTETAFWVSKPRTKFKLRPRIVRAVPGIETLHTHVILSYEFDNGHIEELVIGAELFNLLMELREGYQISDAQSDDTFANLSIFKQRLAQEGDRVLFAWNPANEQVMKLEASIVDGIQKLVIAPATEGISI